ncbi:cytochrome P450 [Cristinia sonorae]|uniref:Cytochrome P450 n=1 Tax=Cristinia sonorae TaxID=1940300 RepID=A0A8K0UT98_9AGAR|nr:cytochrome P450 [Cristinia sonorae]
MSYSLFDLILVATPLLAGLLLLSVWQEGRRRVQEIPGPKRWPVVGNYFSPKRVYEQFAAPSNEFGPIFGLKIFSKNMVMVTSVPIARELLESRSAIYSNRLPQKMAELCGFQEGMLFQTNSNKLRQGRKLVSMGLAQRQLERYSHIYSVHTATFLANLLESPDNFLHHIRKLPVGLILEVAYGYKVQGDNDPMILRSEEWVEHFAKATSVTDFLVNWFPILEHIPAWFPGGGFKKTAEDWRRRANEFSWDAYHAVHSAVQRGEAPHSVISSVLTDTPGQYDEDVIVYSAAQIMSGGADTTVCTLSTFMLAMVLHPEVQQRAKAEIDRVLGPNKLPTADDWDELPYIASVVREVIRWHPAVPLLFRNNTEDDVYNGYVIKKDSMIVTNYWAMLHNKDIFPDHRAFRPERWSEVQLDKDIDPFEIAFGFGRRSCPGKASAKELLFTVIASVLATFDINCAKDAHGNDIVPKEEFTDVAIVGPIPFKCLITPRSEHSRQLIEDTLQSLR